MAVDIDSIALDVARRFTEESDPQRRASLQVAIVEAISTGLAQPAELAEQEGNSLEIDQLRELVSVILSTVSLGHQTGPYAYAGEDFERYLREATSDCRKILRMLNTLAATGKQQVGEVQGDARAALEASMPYLETLHSIVGGEARASVWRCIERGRTALAARQPGAQVPARLSNDTVDGELSVASAIDQVLELFPSSGRAALQTLAGLFTHPTVYRYAAPPAQGIDLGQFRTQVAELLRMEFDLEVADPEDHRHDDGASEAERIASKIAALIGQRDAAPGVGNG